MNKKEIINRLNVLNLDKKHYWLVTGAAMVMHGLREDTRDIDLGCTKSLADELERRGCRAELLEDGTRKIRLENDMELFENWLFGDILVLDDIPVISLKGLLKMKKALGREKDARDIKLIEELMKNE